MIPFNTKKPNIFRSEHFKIEIRLPKYKDLDIEDEDDLNKAKLRLYKELKILLIDEVFPSLSVHIIDTPLKEKPKQLTSDEK